jgi:hydrogenase nickel incorporation protein HypA/HybF
MHEMSICESIVQIIEEEAKAKGYGRVRRLWLEIGPSAGIECEALRFSFDAVTRGTIAEHAALEIIETPLLAWCLPCGGGKQLEARFDLCPDCGSRQLQFSSGEELRIKQLEVD